METETIDKLFLELSQITKARTAREIELLRRYEECLAVLTRCKKVLQRASWDEGETDQEVVDAVDNILTYVKLEKEIEKEGD